MVTRLRNDRKHVFQNMSAAGIGLIDGLFHNFNWQAMNFHIHLEGGNSLFGTSDLEVHIASEIFGVHEVSEDIGFVKMLGGNFGALFNIYH